MGTEPPAKVRVGKKPAGKVKPAPTPDIEAIKYVKAWSAAAEEAYRRQRQESPSLRLRAVALLLEEPEKPTLRAPKALVQLAPEHPAVRLNRALEAVRVAIELHKQPVTAHETDDWGGWREGKRDEALEALRGCAAMKHDLTDTADGLFVAPISEAALARSVADIAGTLLSLVGAPEAEAAEQTPGDTPAEASAQAVSDPTPAS